MFIQRLLLTSCLTGCLVAQELEFRLSSGGELRNIIYDGSQYVALDTQLSLVSEDGTSWEPSLIRESNSRFSYVGVTHHDGTYVGVGNSRHISVSTDGKVWEPFSIDQVDSDFYASVAYGAGRYIAVGDTNGNIIQSSDGKMWADVTFSNTEPLEDITFSDGVFLAIGKDSRLLTSPDGLTWSSQNPVFNDLSNTQGHQVSSFGSQYVAQSTDEIAFSNDATTWTRLDLPTGFWRAVALNGTTTVIVGNENGAGKIATSTDQGASWTTTIPDQGTILEAITYGDAGFMAVSREGAIIQSPDGINWTASLDARPGNRNSSGRPRIPVKYLGGQYVALAGGIPQVSPDATNWETINIQGASSSTGINEVAFLGGRYIALGSRKLIASGENIAEMSVGTALPTSVNANVSFADVAYGDGKWIAVVGEEEFAFSSTDAITWQQITLPDNRRDAGINRIVYGNGRFIALSTSNNTGLTSTDGVTWRELSQPEIPFVSIFDLKFINGEFLAIFEGSLHSSSTGLSWTERFDPPLLISTIHYDTAAQDYYLEGQTSISKHLFVSKEVNTGWEQIIVKGMPVGELSAVGGNLLLAGSLGMTAFASRASDLNANFQTLSPTQGLLSWRSISGIQEVWANNALSDEWQQIPDPIIRHKGFRAEMEINYDPQRPKRFFQIRNR